MKIKLRSSADSGILSYAACELSPRESGSSEGMFYEDLSGKRVKIFADVIYELNILWEEEVPRRFSLYLNGEPLCSGLAVSDETEMRIFTRRSGSGEVYPVFENCYGFARFELKAEFGEDGGEQTSWYRSEYLEIMLRRRSEDLSGMFEFVGQYYRRFFLADVPQLNDLQGKQDKSFNQQMRLIGQIIDVYSRYLPWFKTRPHHVLKSRYEVDDISKLRTVSPDTLNYIVQHPEELVLTDADFGIQVDGNQYYPRKTLILSPFLDRGCYENIVVVNFLKTLLDEIDSLLIEVDRYMEIFEHLTPEKEGYYSSAGIILELFQNQQKERRSELTAHRKNAASLYHAYRTCLPVEERKISYLPKPTAVFFNKEAYRQVYEVMTQWFAFGRYAFTTEEFMLPFMVNYSLYEHYVLLKLLAALENNGFRYQQERSCRYSYSTEDLSHVQQRHTNTFVFENDEQTIATVYFQPVIFGGTYSDEFRNGIGLRRTTSLSWDSVAFPEQTERVYTPDYVIKIEKNGKCVYLIADAKYSRFSTDRIREAIFKYGFSIHPTEENSRIAGTVLFFGREYNEPSGLNSIHDIYEAENERALWYTFLSETNGCSPEDQNEMFSDLLGKLI